MMRPPAVKNVDGRALKTSARGHQHFNEGMTTAF
jgi:hypothetical protein